MINPLRIANIVLIIILISVTIARYEGWRVDQLQEQQLDAHVTDLAQMFRHFAVLPAILATDPRLGIALTEPDDDKRLQKANDVSHVLRMVTDRSDAAFAFVIDTSGYTIAASNFEQRISFVGKNYGFRPYFSKAMSGNSATYFAVGATTGVPGYFVSEPIVSSCCG